MTPPLRPLLNISLAVGMGAALAACAPTATFVAGETGPPEETLAVGALSFVPGAPYTLLSACGDKALDVKGASGQAGADVQQWQSSGAANQQWQIDALPGGYDKLTARHSGKTLEARPAGAKSAAVVQGDPGAGDAQQWRRSETAPGLFKIENKSAPGLVLAVKGGSADNGAAVRLEPDQGACAQRWQLVRVDTQRYDGPLTITHGGSYGGNWQSLDPNVAAVTIKTSEPVVIENAHIRGKGTLILGVSGHLRLTVRGVRAYGLNPGQQRRAPGRFLQADGVDALSVEHNSFVNTRGISVKNFTGSRDGAQPTLQVRYNKAENINGRYSNGGNGYLLSGATGGGWDWAQFLQLDRVTGVPNVDVSWNQVINAPDKSRVEDNISVYMSSGTPNSPIAIHDNYIQGAYPSRPQSSDYTGGGILLGDNLGTGDAASQPAWVRAYDNQVVSTANYGVGIYGGHDLQAYNNRVVSSGKLADGREIGAGHAAGIYVWDGNPKGGRFYNNVAHDNAIGLLHQLNGKLVRGDTFLPDCAKSADGSSACANNQSLPDPITLASEQAEFVRWQDKLRQQGVQVGAPGGMEASG